MNVWELRQAIESLIPAWVVIPLIAFAVVTLVVYAYLVQRRP